MIFFSLVLLVAAATAQECRTLDLTTSAGAKASAGLSSSTATLCSSSTVSGELKASSTPTNPYFKDSALAGDMAAAVATENPLFQAAVGTVNNPLFEGRRRAPAPERVPFAFLAIGGKPATSLADLLKGSRDRDVFLVLDEHDFTAACACDEELAACKSARPQPRTTRASALRCAVGDYIVNDDDDGVICLRFGRPVVGKAQVVELRGEQKTLTIHNDDDDLSHPFEFERGFVEFDERGRLIMIAGGTGETDEIRKRHDGDDDHNPQEGRGLFWTACGPLVVFGDDKRFLRGIEKKSIKRGMARASLVERCIETVSSPRDGGALELCVGPDGCFNPSSCVADDDDELIVRKRAEPVAIVVRVGVQVRYRRKNSDNELCRPSVHVFVDGALSWKSHDLLPLERSGSVDGQFYVRVIEGQHVITVDVKPTDACHGDKIVINTPFTEVSTTDVDDFSFGPNLLTSDSSSSSSSSK